MNPLIRKRSATMTAATAGLSLVTSPSAYPLLQLPATMALSASTATAFVSSGRRYKLTLFASRKTSGNNNQNNRSSSHSIVEEVQPLTSVPKERRLNALNALTQQQLKKGSKQGDKWFEESPLFADMDAAAMLLETFTQATKTKSSDEGGLDIGIARRRMGSVPGATSMSMLKQKAAEEGGFALPPRESEDLYKNDGSSKNRRAVESLIEKLEVKIKELPEDEYDVDENATSKLPASKRSTKTKKGRPRTSPLPDESGNSEVIQVSPLKPIAKAKLTASSTRVTGGKLMKNRDVNPGVSNSNEYDSSKTSPVTKGTAKLVEPLIGASAIVKKQRRRVVKQLPKSRRDEDGNLMPGATISRLSSKSKGQPEPAYTGRGSPDSLNLNRYYKTELLTAKEEYSLGMKVKFMVKCEAVHEGLTVELGRAPTIAEWAAACGFDSYDPEMSSENYVETELDKQIRPAGGDSPDLDPNMFVGNGLVNDTGVGRGKGRARKPPPKLLGKFFDDSYEKFKKNEDESVTSDDESEDETDIFLHRQKIAPGQPINRGSPRIFREMILTAKEAKQKMVQCNMRLVVSIARRYHGVGVNVQDLVQEGSLGLARAAEKFDPKKGFKFSTYASWWIQQAVFRSIAYHSRTIRLPVHVHNLLNKVRRARQILQQELGRMPTNEEMADEMDMSIEKYNKMIRSTRNAISLERPKYKNNPKDLGHESEALVGDMVDSAAVIFDEKTPEQNVDHGLLHSDIQYMLEVRSIHVLLHIS
ncbi:hypothetical protein ACHAXS_008015 [Conticribra weissflogii]